MHTEAPMHADQQQIRELIARWLDASKAGDVDTVLSLITDDVVFLVPGRPPMLKDEFAAASRPQPGAPAPAVDGRCDIQEIQVAGDWAFMWTRLFVAVTPPGQPEPVERAGHTLTVLRKVNGRWLLARDANMLTPVPKPA